MSKLTRSATRAAASIFHGDLIGLLIVSVLITLAVLAAFVLGMGFFSSWLSQHFEGSDNFFVENLTWFGTAGAAFLAILLFPGITPVIISFFDQRISRLIERRYYPGSPPPIETAFLPELLHDLRFALKAILYNIIVLPLYFIPPINVVIFYVLNGFLLGQEYFLMVARRHMPVADAKILYRKHKSTIVFGGALLAFLTTIPVVNLAAPFWGVALMVHLYHQLGVVPRMGDAPSNDNNGPVIEHPPTP